MNEETEIQKALKQILPDLNLNDPQEKQVAEIFISAFKLGAVFGWKTSIEGCSMTRLIELLERGHPTPTDKPEVQIISK